MQESTAMTQTSPSPQITDAPYSWLLFGDLSTGNTGARIWQSGPNPEKPRATMHDLLDHGTSFRLINKEGVAMYEGYIIGEYKGEEPYEEYGRDHGCVSIEYDW